MRAVCGGGPAMRKLRVTTFLTLDGVMQAPGGPEEDPSDTFTHGGWQAPFRDLAVGALGTEPKPTARPVLFRPPPTTPLPRRSTRCPSTSCPTRSARPMPRGAASTPTPLAS